MMSIPRLSTIAARASVRACLLAAAFCMLVTGCSAFRAANRPITRLDPLGGYAGDQPDAPLPGDDMIMAVSLSGGGTRAAALSYGVLRAMRDLVYESEEGEQRLLDEIDLMASVSGGSFTSAYYGLHGDGLFDDYEDRFLKRNIQLGLLLQMLRPDNLFRGLLSFFNRTELAIRYYDEKIFGGATFNDMAGAGGPPVLINTTDMSSGHSFVFNQPQFDLICSDLGRVKVARAVAASAAVPVVFPTVVLQNYRGRCPYTPPDWYAEALGASKSNPRRYQRALAMSEYLGRDAPRYIHLVDGGVSDNLGIRPQLDSIIAAGGIWKRFRHVGADADVPLPKYLVYLVVNAQAEPRPPFRGLPKPPSLTSMLNSVAGLQMYRINFETLELLRHSMEEWKAEFGAHGHELKTFLIHVNFNALDDPEERAYFNDVPTSLSLPDETVDRLVEVGGRLLRSDDAFLRLSAEIGLRDAGTPAASGPRDTEP